MGTFKHIWNRLPVFVRNDKIVFSFYFFANVMGGICMIQTAFLLFIFFQYVRRQRFCLPAATAIVKLHRENCILDFLELEHFKLHVLRCVAPHQVVRMPFIGFCYMNINVPKYKPLYTYFHLCTLS